jgi:uncharacterized membrane protein YidH (DUF202 family)
LRTRGLLLAAFVLFLFAAFRPAAVRAENAVTLYFFHLSTCTNCGEEEEALVGLQSRYDNLRIVKYEVTDPANDALFLQVRTAFGDDTAGTPYTVVGGIAFTGYSTQLLRDLETVVVRYSTGDYVDVVAKIAAGITPDPGDFDEFGYEEGDVIEIPIIGEIAIEDLSLGIATVVIGFVDGFNPCAMWVLLFLITLLADMGNRRRMWVLCSAFLAVSGLMYFLFMAAWLNVALSFASIVWIRIAIGLFAFGFGVVNLVRFFRKLRKPDDGCEVADAAKKRRIADRIRRIVASSSLFVALGGIAVLAVSVNFVELACSVYLPFMYVNILAYHDLAPLAYYGFLALYILFFLLDDLVVFAIAMISMKTAVVSAKYAKWATLAAGIIMVTLGILLVFFPEIATLKF